MPSSNTQLGVPLLTLKTALRSKGKYSFEHMLGPEPRRTQGSQSSLDLRVETLRRPSMPANSRRTSASVQPGALMMPQKRRSLRPSESRWRVPLAQHLAPTAQKLGQTERRESSGERASGAASHS